MARSLAFDGLRSRCRGFTVPAVRGQESGRVLTRVIVAIACVMVLALALVAIDTATARPGATAVGTVVSPLGRDLLIVRVDAGLLTVPGVPGVSPGDAVELEEWVGGLTGLSQGWRCR